MEQSLILIRKQYAGCAHRKWISTKKNDLLLHNRDPGQKTLKHCQIFIFRSWGRNRRFETTKHSVLTKILFSPYSEVILFMLVRKAKLKLLRNKSVKGNYSASFECHCTPGVTLKNSVLHFMYNNKTQCFLCRTTGYLDSSQISL